MLRRGRLVARLEHDFDRNVAAGVSPAAKVIVALVGRDAKNPVLKRRIAAILAELEIDLNKDVLADVLEFGGIAGEPGRDAEDAPFVASGKLGKGLVIPGERRLDELLVR